VKDVEWARDSTEVRWFGPDGYVNKSYGQPPVRVLRLEGKPGVAVIEPRLEAKQIASSPSMRTGLYGSKRWFRAKGLPSMMSTTSAMS
jgi:hypothetical protein